MARIETWLTCNLGAPPKIHFIDGNFFSKDNGGNLIGVKLFDADGHPVNVDGTVSGEVIRPDGETVPITNGVSDGNKCYVILPQAAYLKTGLISITVQVSSGGVVTTVGGVVGNVYPTSTDTTIDPSTVISDIAALVSSIDTAINNIPADYSAIMKAIAPLYADLKYPITAGKLCWYNGVLYKAISDIAASETWDSTHWSTYNITDIDSRLNEGYYFVDSGNIFNNQFPTNGNISESGGNSSSSVYKRTGYLPVDSSNEKLYFTRSELPYVLMLSFYDSSKVALGENGNRSTIWSASSVSVNTNIAIPEGAAYFRMSTSIANYKGTLCISYSDMRYALPYLKNKLSFEKTKIDSLHNLVDYGYSIDSEYNVSGPLTIKRVGTRLILDGELAAPSSTSVATFVIRVNGSVYAVAGLSDYKTKYGGIFLQDGHKYRWRIKKISGVVSRDIWRAGVFMPNTEAEISKLNAFGNFQDGTKYADFVYSSSYTSGLKLSMLIDRGDSGVTFSNAHFECQLEDITFSENYAKDINIDYSLRRESNLSADYKNGKYISMNVGIGDRLFDPASTVVFGTSSSYGCKIMKCHAGDQFKLTASASSDGTYAKAWAFLDVDGYVMQIASDGDSVNNKEFVAEKDGYFISNHLVASTYSLIAKTLIQAADYSIEERIRNADIPDYYFDNYYLDGRIDDIIGNRNTFANRETPCTKLIESIFITDPHFYRDDILTSDNGLQSPKLIKYIIDKTNIGDIICGGDMVNGSTMTNLQCRSLFSSVRKLMEPIWDHTLMCIGNHEWNNPGASSAQEVNELSFIQIYNAFIADKSRYYGSREADIGCYYVDNPVDKIRTFYLGCTRGGVMTYNSFKWFFDAVVNTPTGYSILVYSHIALSRSNGETIWIDQTFEAFLDLLSAAKNRLSFAYNWPSTSWTGSHDFNTDPHDVIAVISGHYHMDIDKYTYADMLTQFANNTFAEWVSGTSYAVGDTVKVTTTSNGITTVIGYECRTANSDTTFTVGNWKKRATISSGRTWEGDYTFKSIPVIGVTCDRAALSSNGDVTKAARVIGTIGEQAFDVVQIDMTNRTINLTRIGGSTVGASYDSSSQKLYDTEVGNSVLYTATQWVNESTHKDRSFTY